MENRRREEAHLRSRMPTWKPERAFKEREGKKLEEMVNKIQKKMRKHRKKVKEEIKDYEKLRRSKGDYSSDMEYSDDDQSDSDKM